VPVPSYYSDKDELYHFPMTYPKYDSTTFKFSTASNTMIPIKYSKTGYRVTLVDGWGTITTPYGTSPCLRLVTTQYSQDSIKNTFVPFPVGFPNHQRSYQWLNTTSKIPYLEITGNLTGNGTTFTPTQARFRDIPAVPQGVEEHENTNTMIVYPNPVKDKLHFNTTKEGDVVVEIYDLKGSLIISQKLRGGQISMTSVDVDGLKPGPYVMKLSGNGSLMHLKFIKE
ncbi:MAG: hypothetical protein K0S26_3474, partial [Bacteroidota bacterium]|nr:hypothetical protein [Bacteroidota bacterium]